MHSQPLPQATRLSRRRLLLAACAAPHAGVSEQYTTSEVRTHRGRPTLFVNGRPHLIPIFETYAPEERYFRDFARAGSHIHSFSVSFGGYLYSDALWTGPAQWDFTPLDERVARVLRADPHALILPRVYLGTPAWWLQAHPEEQLVLHDGSRGFPRGTATPVPVETPFASLASQRWRRELGEGVQRLLRHALAAPYARHLAGWMLTGLFTEEWYHWSAGAPLLGDYHPAMTDRFREWLRQRYGTEARLRHAWSDPAATFATAALPDYAARTASRGRTFREPQGEQRVIDFYRFHNEIIPETIGHFCGTARRELVVHGARQVLGAFYGYMFEFAGDPDFGHNALGRLLQVPDLDFVMVTASYFHREHGRGADYMRGPLSSLALHGKLWHHDNDTVSFLYHQRMAAAGLPRDRIAGEARLLGAMETPLQSTRQYRRGAGFALANGAQQSFFDLHGGYFDHPELMAEVRRLNGVFARAAAHDRRSGAQVLIVADEASCEHTGYRGELLRQALALPQPELARMGTPHDSLLLEDLAGLSPAELDGYRLVVFLNCYHLTPRQRAVVRRLQRGRWLLWCTAPGLFQDCRTDTGGMERLTGLRIVPVGDEQLTAPRMHLEPPRAGEPPLAAALRRACPPVLGPATPSTRRFAVLDPRATVLARSAPGGMPVLAMRRHAGGIALYSLTAALPAAFYRELARAAGAHLYNEVDEAFYLNASYLVLHAAAEGVRTLLFPEPVILRDAVSRRLLAEDTREWSTRLEFGETLLLLHAPARGQHPSPSRRV